MQLPRASRGRCGAGEGCLLPLAGREQCGRSRTLADRSLWPAAVAGREDSNSRPVLKHGTRRFQMDGGHGEKSSRKREQAIAALLSEASVEAAAAKAGIGTTTLKRWLAEPSFRRLYGQARTGLLERVVQTLLAASTRAVETLERNLTCDKPSVQVRAAEVILSRATRGVELLDLAQRIEELELRAEAKQ
jgi:transposase-like protein